MKKLALLWSLSILIAAGPTQAEPKATAGGLDTARIEQLTGAKGKLDDKAGVFKVSAPRSDLKVNVAGVHLTPPMGLTSWAAFTPAGKHTAVMGDIVLTEDQVNPVMSAALDHGLEVTALHNHFFWDTPKVMFMHIGGMGEQQDLARGVGAVLAAVQATRAAKVSCPGRTSTRPRARWIRRSWTPPSPGTGRRATTRTASTRSSSAAPRR